MQKSKNPAVENKKSSTRKKQSETKETFGHRNKPVSTSTAQNNTLCGDGKAGQYDYEWFCGMYEKACLIDKKIGVIISLQYEGGLRISEVLSLKHSHILPNGQIIVEGKKGSEKRVISIEKGKDYLLRAKRNKAELFEGISRFAIHRLYKKLGISFQSTQSTKVSTTHAFRHIKAKMLREETRDDNLITRELGHKSSKNQKFYGKEAKK